MKVFHCDHCDHLVAYLPSLGVVGSLDDAGDGTWRSPIGRAGGHRFRLCENYTTQQVCNWAVDADDAHTLCESCRLTRLIPDLTAEANRGAWYRLEAAKRRLVYTLMALGLPIASRDEDPERGLTFEFLADQPDRHVLTGHATGVITINIAEADDAEREKRRVSLNEPFRTLAGHFRHEIAHYYWDRLIADSRWLDEFRRLFGDERNDYGAALQAYYANGPAADWGERHVTAYASAHPLEDWAETWAHYLHMIDTLETAAACGFALRPRRQDEPTMTTLPPAAFVVSRQLPFERLIDGWFPLTYALNNLTRGLGLADAYPFVLGPIAVEKLRFVHAVIAEEDARPAIAVNSAAAGDRS